MPRTSATRQGSQTKKLEEIKHANNVAIAAKSEAVLITKLEAAEKNAAAAEARKARAREKKQLNHKREKFRLQRHEQQIWRQRKLEMGKRIHQLLQRKKNS
jgi:hypothetical protein